MAQVETPLMSSLPLRDHENEFVVPLKLSKRVANCAANKECCVMSASSVGYLNKKSCKTMR